MTLGGVGISMKMPVVPALVVQAIFQLIEKCRKSIDGGAIPARCRIERRRKHARRASVGDHVVDLPAHAVELCPCLLKVGSSGSSCGHQLEYGMRYSLSTLVAPPMVKTVEPSSSKTSPRVRRRMGEVSDRRCVSPPCHNSMGRSAQWSKRSWLPSTNSTV